MSFKRFKHNRNRKILRGFEETSLSSVSDVDKREREEEKANNTMGSAFLGINH